MDEVHLPAAHRASIHHRMALTESAIRRGFSRDAVFPPARITPWTDAGDTAICPFRGIDAVLGAASGFPITAAFLERMQARGFRQSECSDENPAQIQDRPP